MRRPPAALWRNQVMPSPIWIDERDSSHGSVRPNGLTRVPLERGRAEPLAHRPVGRRGARQRLRVGEVGRRPTGVLGDQVDRAVELVGHVGVGRAVEQRVACGCGTPSTRRRSTAMSVTVGPRQGQALGPEAEPAVDVVGGQVERGRHAVALEDRRGDLGQVGGAVVERDRRSGRAGRGGPVGRPRVGPVSRSMARSRVTTRPDAASSAICSSNSAVGRSTVIGRPGADPVVGQHDDARLRGPHAVDGGRRDLDRLPGPGHRRRRRLGLERRGHRSLHAVGRSRPARRPTGRPRRRG